VSLRSAQGTIACAVDDQPSLSLLGSRESTRMVVSSELDSQLHTVFAGV